MKWVDEETLESSAAPTYTSHKVLQEGGVVDVHLMSAYENTPYGM